MPQLNGIAGTVVPQTIQHAAPQQGAGGVRPSVAGVAGRVALGLVTLGFSEIIRAVVKSVAADLAAPAPRVQTPGTPATRPEDDLQNTVLADRIRQGKTLSPAFRAALQEGVNDLREAFGDDLIPREAGFATMPCSIALKQNLAKAVANAGEEVTPQQLRDMIRSLGVPLMAEQILQDHVAHVARTAGHERDPSILRSSVQNGVPGLDEALKAAATRQEAEAVVGTFAPAIEARVALQKELHDLQVREENRAVTALAEGTGLSEETVRAQLDNTNLHNRLVYLAQDFYKGINTARGEERSNAFRAVADAFVQNKLALWYSVDSLPLSPQEGDLWKTRVLTSRELGKADMLNAFHQAGSQVDAAPLLQLLNTPGVTPEEIVGYMQSLALRVVDRLQTHYGPEGWSDLGADGQFVARDFAFKSMLDAVPGLGEALQARAEALQPLLTAGADRATDALGVGVKGLAEEQAKTEFLASTAAMALLQSDVLPPAEHNGQLARSLGRPTMSPPHLQAVEQCMVEARIRFGEDCLPAGTPDQALRAHDPLTGRYALENLEKAVRESTTPVGSTDMARLTAEAVHAAAVRGACIGLLHESASVQGVELSDDTLRTVMDTLARRHPYLWQNLGEAENRDDLRARLASLPEVKALLLLEADMQRAWSESMNMVYAEISSNTGLPEEDVRAKLDVRDLESASLLYLRQALRDIVRNPDVVPDAFPDTVSNPDKEPNAFPTSDRVHKQFQEVAKAFIEGKITLYASLESMELSPALKENWKEQVLTNPTLKKGDFLSLGLQAAERMRDVGLPRALADESVSTEELLGLLHSMGMRLDTHMRDVLGDSIQRMGSDDTGVFGRFVREVLADRRPELFQVVQDRRERTENLIEAAENRLIDLQHSMNRVSSRSPRMQELREEYAFLASGTALLKIMLHPSQQ